MAKFFMFGKYSSGALKDMSAKRTEKASELLKKLGGRVEFIYALLGEYDLVIIADFAGAEEAMKASVALSKLTGIGFNTCQAIGVEQFDKMMADL